jgi:lysophospholipid acyltransferase (LPLAT)-like uncharacterized protein
MPEAAVIDKKNAVKGGTKEKIIGSIAGWLMQIAALTMRVRFQNREHYEALNGAVILCFWHGQIIPATIAWLCKCPRHHPLVALTSASRDGAMIEYVMKTHGVESVRGSSSRRGLSALIELKKAINQGKDICITPDGPRGPAKELQPGLLKIAQLTGAPLLPLRIICSSSWKLKTWDGFEIPKPFATLHLVIDRPIFIPRTTTDDEWSSLIVTVTNKLSEIDPIH